MLKKSWYHLRLSVRHPSRVPTWDAIVLTALQLATLPAIRDEQPRFSSSASIKFNPIQPNRPTTSSMSSTIESFSGPKVVSNPVSRVKIVYPVAPDDCRSDCDSSSSVVDDDNDDYCVLTSSIRKIQLCDSIVLQSSIWDLP